MIADQPMRLDVDLDWVTYKCPCGSTCCTRFLDQYTIDGWVRDHRPHTNGKLLEHTTADGNRAWGTPQPDRLVDL